MKTTIRLIRDLALAGTAGMLLASSVIAQEMNYQGRLTDAAGDPFVDGDYTLTFRLFDAATGGNLIWGPFITDGVTALNGHGPLIPLANGRFNAAIGPEDTDGDLLADVFAGGDRYLELTVGSNAAITPRQRMLHSPEAFNAATLGKKDSYKISQASAISFGNATNNGWQPDQGEQGLLIEADIDEANGGHPLQPGGLFMNGDRAVLYNKGDDALFQIFDTDDLTAPNGGSPKFNVDQNGGISASSNSSITGNLNVSGNITAGTITGTLTTPSLQLPNNLSVGTTSTSHKVVIQSTNEETLRLIGPDTSGSGARLNFGDNDYVYFDEPFDDGLRIQANEVGIGGDPINGGDKLQVFGSTDISGSLDVDGFTQLDGFNSAGNGTVNGTLNVNRTGSFATTRLKSTQTTAADTFPMELIGEVPGNTFTWLWRIDSSDVNDADLVIDFGRNDPQQLIAAILEPSGSGWRAGSDRKLKENITPIDECLELVSLLKPKSYNYIASPDEQRRCGFIAQEVQEVMPSLVKQVDDILTLNYGEFGVLAVGAVNELKIELDAEKAKNAALEARIQAIEDLLAK